MRRVFRYGVAVLLCAASSCGGGGSRSLPLPPDGDPTTVVGIPTPDISPDPLYGFQWHLKNTGQSGAVEGEDVNAEAAWTEGYTGSGARVVVVDDGLEIGHVDLSGNVVAGASYNYVSLGTDPTGGAHGTCVAGVAASVGGNDHGGRGVAYDAGLIGYNVLQNLTSANEADAMTRGLSGWDVSNNSWGPDDGTGRLEAPGTLWEDAVESGVTSGRGGKGAVYVWAAGNGNPADNSNYDGYANHREVMAVCAVGDDGIAASYSESGANLWICAPSQGGSGQAITTTDRTGSSGYNRGARSGDYEDTDYTNTFNGTSSATPVVAGAAVVILDANPDLTWRDVRLIIAESARQNDPLHSGWFTNGGGYLFNHQYGFGVVDLGAAVALAEGWINAGTEVSYETSVASPGLTIPDNDTTGVSHVITVSGSEISAIEFVYVHFSAANHAYSGDLRVTLEHETTGTIAVLAVTHACASDICTPYDDWRFGAAAFLGESADGDWRLTVKDQAAADTGTFQSWKLRFFGH